jgi:hypothetical protein
MNARSYKKKIKRGRQNQARGLARVINRNGIRLNDSGKRAIWEIYPWGYDYLLQLAEVLTRSDYRADGRKLTTPRFIHLANTLEDVYVPISEGTQAVSEIQSAYESGKFDKESDKTFIPSFSRYIDALEEIDYHPNWRDIRPHTDHTVSISTIPLKVNVEAFLSGLPERYVQPYYMQTHVKLGLDFLIQVIAFNELFDLLVKDRGMRFIFGTYLK